MAPGRQFKVFSFGTAGVGPEPVRGLFVAVTDQIGTLVGGMERALLGDSGSVISFWIGSKIVTRCGRTGGAVGTGPV